MINLFDKSLISVAGGTMPKDHSCMVKAPGARPNARWMSKGIYSLKIALFRKQLAEALPHDHLESITNLAIFLCPNYVESWTISLVALLGAAKNDLMKRKTLQLNLKAVQKHPKRYPDGYSSMTASMLKKLYDFLWYLSERLVVLSLFSDKLSGL